MAATSSTARTPAVFRQPRKLSRAFRTSTSPRGAFALLAVLLVSLVIVAPGDGYPAASAGQWSAGFEPYPCDSMAYGEEAKLDYMTELFERMVRTDRNVASSSEGQAQWERIIAIEKQSPSTHTHWLTFNISPLSDADNMTMAKVAVITCGRKNSCQPSLKESRRKRKLPCENNPFMIYDLATVDVTSLLARRLGAQRFHIYAKRMGHLQTAMLVIFSGVNTAQLLQDKEPVRFGRPLFRKRRKADVISSLRKRRVTESDVIPGSSGERGDQASRGPAGAKGRSHRAAPSGESGRNVPDLHDKLNGQSEASGSAESLLVETPDADSSKTAVETPPSSEPRGFNPGWESRRKDAKQRLNQPSRNSILHALRGRQVGRDRRKMQPRQTLSSAMHAPVFKTPEDLLRHLNGRRKRSAAGANHSDTAEPYTRSPGSCQLKNFTVLPFEDLNIPGFISPRYLDIGSCEGDCPPILQPSDRVPQYSHITSMLHFRWPDAGWPVPAPSCRPRRFQSFSVMRWVGDDIVIERWVNARVIECGCV